jgi:hypothetical protein
MKVRSLLVALVIGATPLVLGTAVQACGSPGCAVEQPDEPAIPQTPEDCSGGSNCATPTPPAQKLVCAGSNCAVEQPSDEPIITQEPTPRPAPQRADATTKPIIVAECGSGC